MFVLSVGVYSFIFLFACVFVLRFVRLVLWFVWVVWLSVGFVCQFVCLIVLVYCFVCFAFVAFLPVGLFWFAPAWFCLFVSLFVCP